MTTKMMSVFGFWADEVAERIAFCIEGCEHDVNFAIDSVSGIIAETKREIELQNSKYLMSADESLRSSKVQSYKLSIKKENW